MLFAGISYLAVFLAATAGFAVGMVWYMALGRAWTAALDKTEDDFESSPWPFIVAAVSLLVMAFMLAGLIGHLGEVTVARGVVSAFSVWFGFVVTPMAVNHAFQNTSRLLTLIDAGHWLAVLIVMGIVIGAIGV